MNSTPQVEIRRSTRRRRTVQARVEGDRIIVLVPARMAPAEEAKIVQEMVAKLRAKTGVPVGRRSDAQLADRAEAVRRRYLPEGPRPTSVRWVTNQNSRWGSCTPSTGRIRLSHRLQGMPDHVLDYVLLHELAHLVHADHSPPFWTLLAGFERAETAKAYLSGAAFAAGWSEDHDSFDDPPPLGQDHARRAPPDLFSVDDEPGAIA